MNSPQLSSFPNLPSANNSAWSTYPQGLGGVAVEPEGWRAIVANTLSARDRIETLERSLAVSIVGNVTASLVLVVAFLVLSRRVRSLSRRLDTSRESP